MKTEKLLNIFCLTAIMLFFSEYSRAQNWVAVNIGEIDNLWGVQFINENTGYVIGEYGYIGKTTNGGTSWSTLPGTGGVHFKRIRMINANTGFVCGHNGVVSKTNDGGVTWTVTDFGSMSFYGMDVNGNTVHMVGDDRNQARTTNFGSVWVSSLMSGVTGDPDIYGMEMLSATTMLVCTQAYGTPVTPKAYRTTNGGLNWSIALQFSSGIYNNSDLNDILFINSSTGFTGGTNGRLLRSTSGGVSWLHTTDLGYSIRQIYFKDAQTGYVCGGGGKVSFTTNSGLNWTTSDNGVTTLELKSVFAINELTVWCCGPNGVLIKSTNGGGIFASPSNLSANAESASQINLTWQDNSLIESGFYIERSNDGVSYVLIDSVSSNVNSYINSGLSSNTLYHYRVYAKYGSTLSGFTNTDTEYTFLDTPSLTFPLDGAPGLLVTPDFSCSIVSGASNYHIQIASDTGFNTINYNDSGFALNAFSIPGGILQYGNTYYWRVKAKNENTISAFSEHRSFSTSSCNSNLNTWTAMRNGTGNGNDYINKVVCDYQGNVYVTGISKGSGTSDYDVLTIKYNSDGITQWTQTFNGSGDRDDYGFDIAVDDSGNVFVTGLSQDAVNSNYVTIKYNSSGVLQWSKIYDATGFWDVGVAITLDETGYIYVTGQSYDPATTYDYATIKYDNAGNVVWIRRYSGAGVSYDEARSISIDASGNVYITGLSTISGNIDYMTLKYNSSGTLQWSKSYNGTGNSNDYGTRVFCDYAGNVYVTGQSTGSGSAEDYLTIKYNSSGTEIWTKRYNGTGNNSDIPISITMDAFNNVYVSGYSKNAASDFDYLSLKYDSSGTELWNQRYDGPGNSNDYAYALMTDISGNLYVTGSARTGDSSITENIATIKYGPGGNLIKTLNHNGSGNGSDKGNSLSIDCSGNVYVAGLTTSANQDYITIKYQSSDFIPYVNLDLRVLIEGLYFGTASGAVTVSDTVTVYLRNSATPYSIVDSSKGMFDGQGNVSLNFMQALNNTSYYISIEHRNSIETWSSNPVTFISDTLSYDFTVSLSQAYGSNLILKGSEYCIYSGDVSQDGIVDGSDGILIDNDAANFNTGYIPTDLNGDEITDGSDALIADNNAANFVSAVLP